MGKFGGGELCLSKAVGKPLEGDTVPERAWRLVPLECHPPPWLGPQGGCGHWVGGPFGRGVKQPGADGWRQRLWKGGILGALQAAGRPETASVLGSDAP